MARSQLTAVLRVFPRGRRQFSVYYVDLFDELNLIQVCDAKTIQGFAESFAKNNGFEAFEIQFGVLQGKWTGETEA